VPPEKILEKSNQIGTTVAANAPQLDETLRSTQAACLGLHVLRVWRDCAIQVRRRPFSILLVAVPEATNSIKATKLHKPIPFPAMA
jgi:hypothetical protein